MTGYKTDPVDEYEHILTNLKPVLSEAEEEFNTAELRMALTARSNREENIDKLSTEQVNWGLDYLRRQELVDAVGLDEIGKRANYGHDWLKNGYTDEKLEEIIDELEY